MLDLEEINNTIEELKSSPTTFDTCIKLSALYTVRDHLVAPVSEVEHELSDVLPAYRKYTEIKLNYQTGNSSEQAVLRQLKILCQEIEDFISVLYSCTDTTSERHNIEETVFSIYQKLMPQQTKNT